MEGADVAKGTCSHEGCGRPAYARGWCRRDYQQWYRKTRPASQRSLPRRGAKPKTPAEEIAAFQAKVKVRGKHWIWLGARNRDGYGINAVAGGKRMLAHRAAYTLLVGPIPEGLVIDHTCRWHPCVKPVADARGPAHLEPVTNAENVIRGHASRRARRKIIAKAKHPRSKAEPGIKIEGTRPDHLPDHDIASIAMPDGRERRYCRGCVRVTYDEMIQRAQVRTREKARVQAARKAAQKARNAAATEAWRELQMACGPS